MLLPDKTFQLILFNYPLQLTSSVIVRMLFWSRNLSPNMF